MNGHPVEAADDPHHHELGSPHRPQRWVPLSDSLFVNVMGLAIGVMIAFTAIGLVVLWPSGKIPRPAALATPRTLGATVTRVARIRCGEAGACLRVTARLNAGPDRGTSSTFTELGQITDIGLSPGDHIRVLPTGVPPGAGRDAAGLATGRYQFVDFDRRGPMLWLAVGFVVLLLLTGRMHGLRALIGLAASLTIVVKFVLPGILLNASPIEVAIVGAFAVMLVTMPLSYGLGPKMMAALLGTAASLLLAAGLAAAFVHIAHLTGLASDDAIVLSLAQSHLSVQGLLIAGMVIGALGVLVDLTVSQASTVMALRRANPALGFRELFSHALEVGHDHIAATVNTLVFAYAGASLPVLLIFTVGGTGFTDAVNFETVAVEVIATLIGSIGLIASMPITTALAAMLALHMGEAQLTATAGGHAHAH